MAEINDEISVGEFIIMEVSEDPTLSGGTPAPRGSIAIVKNTTSQIYQVYQKNGSLDTEWIQVITNDLVTSTISYTETYLFERNSTATSYLAIGNGATNDGGVYIPRDGRIVQIAATTDTASVNATYQARIDKVPVATLVFSGDRGHVDVNVPVSQGDALTAFAVSGTAGANPQTVGITVEYDINLTALQGPEGPQGLPGNDGVDGVAQFRFGSGVPSGALGNDGDAYFDISNGDYYGKSGGLWTLQFNAVGPQGPPGAPTDWIKLTNNVTTNSNSSTVGITWAGINTTSLEDTNPGLFTVSTNSITVNQDGEYEVYINLFQTSTSPRTNVGIDIQIDGTATNRTTASSYIRDSSGHLEASTNITEPFILTNGQVISFRTRLLAAAGTVTTPAGQSLIWVKKIG